MPKKSKKQATPPEAEKPAKKRAGPLSLYPLTFEEAVRGLLQVKMPPEKPSKKP
jgi:hypothetical protein